MTRSWRGFQAHERRWPSTEGVLRFIRDLVLPTPPPDLPRPNSSAAPVLNPLPCLSRARSHPPLQRSVLARPNLPPRRAHVRVFACMLAMWKCWLVDLYRVNDVGLLHTVWMLWQQCLFLSPCSLPWVWNIVRIGYDIKVKWTIYILVCCFYKWLHNSHVTFDHTIIEQFNNVICLWNCAMTLCTERGSVMAVSSWHVSLGNRVMTLCIETGLRNNHEDNP